MSREDMRRANSYNNRIEHAQSLLAELRAIRLWDSEYWNMPRHEWWETVALMSRLQRRAEIVAEVAAIVVKLLSDSLPRRVSNGGRKRPSSFLGP